MAVRRGTRSWLVIGAVVALVAAVAVVVVSRDDVGSPAARGGRPFAEPVTLSSVDGVLEVRLTAHEGAAPMDTVSSPVQNAMLFGYEIIRGSSSNGESTGGDLYPGPTLQVQPGERLVVHLENDLVDLAVEDFYDPTFTPVDQPVPLYPMQLTSANLNLHTHGVHVSPSGNSDNVLLDLPAGATNTYVYEIPDDMPQGLYWYHSHRHMLTAAETYQGLAGLLSIGRADGNIPAVTGNDLPVRTMAIQYNYVFDREGGQSQLNNPNWPQYVSTLQEAEQSQLADGTYVPVLAPVNFASSAPGTTFFTNWWDGPLSVNNNRGQFQFIPSNLQGFTSDAGAPTGTVVVAPTGTEPTRESSIAGVEPSIEIPPDPSLPDAQRDLQFTVNGQFQPVIEAAPGQTEIWVLANISDFAYVNVTLTETATGQHPQMAIVGQDGNPYEQVHHSTTDGGTTLLIPPATRYAIAVTMPASGGLVLEMPPLAGNDETLTNEGIAYTNDGTDSPPAVLGTVQVSPSSVSYIDGFFAFPTQVLVRMEPKSGRGVTVPFVEGQELGAFTSFVDTQLETPAVQRTLVVSGGFDNNFASDQDPKAFVYQFDGNAFPYIPLIQPRLGTVEEWSVVNMNNDEHPIHIHVNDFQVMQVVDPNAAITSGVQPWGQDNVNVPAPTMDAAGDVITAGSVTLRTKFLDYTGTYVIHCHRLNHEDNGLMAIVNVIPAVSSYAVAVPGSPGRSSTVQLRDGRDDRLLATVTPFPGFEGTASVAMGDVDGDQILDLVAGSGEGSVGEVAAYSGASGAGGQPFATELARFAPFDDPGGLGGVHVAVGNIEGDATADNIVIGSGPGTDAQVKVFRSDLPALGATPEVFSTVSPYPGSQTGVEVATGMVDAVSGRISVVTAPGPGTVAAVKTYRWDLFTPNDGTDGTLGTDAGTGTTAGHVPDDPTIPTLTSQFEAFDGTYDRGLSLATGWVAGGLGGAQRIIVGQLGAPGQVKVFSSGSALDGQPEMYLDSPTGHSMTVEFDEVASFVPFEGSSGGVRLATTSTEFGADLLVAGIGLGGEGLVRRYEFARGESATTLMATLLGQQPTSGSTAAVLAGA